MPIRLPSPLLALALLLAGCGAHAAGAAPAPVEAPPPAGRVLSRPAFYVARGDFLGTPDEQTVRFFLRGGIREVDRARADGSVVGAGVAIPDVGRLFAAFGPRASSLFLGVYRRVDSEVVGLVAFGGHGLTGIESWSGGEGGTDPYVGHFEVRGSDPGTGEPYTARLSVTREGELLRLRWAMPAGEREAIGILVDDVLAVVGPDQTGVPRAGAAMGSGDRALVVYRGEGEGILLGTIFYFAEGAEPRRGEERLERRPGTERGPADP